MPSRINMTLAVKRLIKDVAARVPELSHVRASRVLVVAGEARGTSRASIRPGKVGPARSGPRRFIRVRGRRMLYVITLRPLWFVASTPEERVATVLHELYHASSRFDGTLHRDRRHSKLPRARYDRHVRELLGRYLALAPDEVLAPFAGEGVVKVRIWLRVPRAARAGARAALDVDQHLTHGYMPLAHRDLRSAGSGPRKGGRGPPRPGTPRAARARAGPEDTDD